MLGEFEDAREEDAPRDAVGGEREQHAQNARERALRRGGLDTFMMFHADAYTTPWHWCLYTFAVEYGRADWAYPVLIYNFYRNTYLLLFFLPGFLVDKVNTDLGTAAAAQITTPARTRFAPAPGAAANSGIACRSPVSARGDGGRAARSRSAR